MRSGVIGKPYGKEKPKISHRRRKLLFLLFFMLLVFFAVYAAYLASSLHSFHNPEDWAQALRNQGSGQELIYLLMGVDYWGASPYVERLVLVHHDTVGENLSVVYIPGNTAIQQEGGTVQAIGQAYRFLKGESFIKLVQDFLSLPVHHYTAVNYQGIIDLANMFDGIAVADLGKASSGLMPGEKERLNGFEAYRLFLTEDIGEPPEDQLERQREIILALWRELDGKKPWQWPSLCGFIGQYVETDLSWNELKALREQLEQISFDSVRVIRLPGERQVIDGYSYWVTEPEAIQTMVKMLNEGYLVVPDEVRVEILNGCGVSGIASRVAELLEKEGFTIVDMGNADRFDYPQSEVIALGERADKARAVCLYIPGASLLHHPDPEAAADVRVIVGKNFSMP